jgi:hypothetical protein
LMLYATVAAVDVPLWLPYCDENIDFENAVTDCGRDARHCSHVWSRLVVVAQSLCRLEEPCC